MSLAMAILSDRPASAPLTRGRGRPRVELDPEQRALHLACAKARLIYGMSAEKVAQTFDVSERTVRDWVRRALTYDGPVADVLRNVHALRG